MCASLNGILYLFLAIMRSVFPAMKLQNTLICLQTKKGFCKTGSISKELTWLSNKTNFIYEGDLTNLATYQAQFMIRLTRKRDCDFKKPFFSDFSRRAALSLLHYLPCRQSAC